MSQHTIQTEVEVHFTFPGLAEGEHETAHPTVEITYDYSRGSPAFTPRGEFGPIDPPEPPGLAFRAAKYIDRDGLDEDPAQLQDWAEQWLLGDGYDYACDCAELDLRAMRHAHLEDRRDRDQ